ncbi:hypothetical protein ACIQU5_34860 [Streptomyces sp. NPDC090306]|uniref:hypothetical protein n=1 Tax=Streptomyces sp. NPDC090306 TaxID=3365961 RepID=UPI003814BC88
MSLRSNPIEPVARPCPTGPTGPTPAVPTAGEAVAFRAAHGLPDGWSAEDFEVYLDLERVGAPAPSVADGEAA